MEDNEPFEPEPYGVDTVFDEKKAEIYGDYFSKVKLFSATLNDTVTDFAVADYTNQTFIVITQFQKIGTLISVTKGNPENLNGGEDLYDIKTVCGLDSEECQLAARYLSDHINITKPILFSICLKDYEPATLKAIGEALDENLSLPL